MLARDRKMNQEISLSQPNSTLTASEVEAVLALVCCFLDGSPLSHIHIVRSSYNPLILKRRARFFRALGSRWKRGMARWRARRCSRLKRSRYARSLPTSRRNILKRLQPRSGRSPLPRFRCPSFLPRCEVPLRNWLAHLRMRFTAPSLCVSRACFSLGGRGLRVPEPFLRSCLL